MGDVETLKGLLARVQIASGASQDLDEAIHAALLPGDPWWQAIEEGRRLVAKGRADTMIYRCNCHLSAGSWANSSKVSAYTRSVDDAMRLAGKALPSASVEVTAGAHKAGRRICTAFIRLGDHDLGECWEAATAPLAICAALLSALIAQAEQGASDGA